MKKKGLVASKLVAAILAFVVLIVILAIVVPPIKQGAKKILEYGKREEVSPSNLNKVLDRIFQTIQACSNSAKDECVCNVDIPRFPEGYFWKVHPYANSVFFLLYKSPNTLKNKTKLDFKVRTNCLFVWRDNEIVDILTPFYTVNLSSTDLIIYPERKVFSEEIYLLPLQEGKLTFYKKGDLFCLVIGGYAVLETMKYPPSSGLSLPPPMYTEIKHMPEELVNEINALPPC